MLVFVFVIRMVGVLFLCLWVRLVVNFIILFVFVFLVVRMLLFMVIRCMLVFLIGLVFDSDCILVEILLVLDIVVRFRLEIKNYCVVSVF